MCNAKHLELHAGGSMSALMGQLHPATPSLSQSNWNCLKRWQFAHDKNCIFPLHCCNWV